MPDYIPQADAAFDTWQTNYVTAFAAKAAVLGFDPHVEGAIGADVAARIRCALACEHTALEERAYLISDSACGKARSIASVWVIRTSVRVRPDDK